MHSAAILHPVLVPRARLSRQGWQECDDLRVSHDQRGQVLPVNSASADQFIKASNFDGTSRKLKRNAYIYNNAGKRVGKTKTKWLKGSTHTVYGGSVKIKGKQYCIVGLNQYVKKANF